MRPLRVLLAAPLSAPCVATVFAAFLSSRLVSALCTESENSPRANTQWTGMQQADQTQNGDQIEAKYDREAQVRQWEGSMVHESKNKTHQRT